MPQTAQELFQKSNLTLDGDSKAMNANHGPTPQQPAAIEIPERELTFSFSCSGGPGGQNVNKRETKVRLSFDVMDSKVLTFDQKTALLRHPSMSHLVHGDGIISITSQVHKTQGSNKAETIERLHALLESVFAPVKERVPGGRPPGLNFPASEHRKRQERREEQALLRELRREYADQD